MDGKIQQGEVRVMKGGGNVSSNTLASFCLFKTFLGEGKFLFGP